MRIAIPHWQDRISPVLDVAGVLLLIDTDRGKETGRQSVTITEEGTLERIRRIKELDVGTIICGAISRPLALGLASSGIEIIAQTCGEVEPVVEAFLNGRLRQDLFLMPGCRRGRRRFRRGRKSGHVCRNV